MLNVSNVFSRKLKLEEFMKKVSSDHLYVFKLATSACRHTNDND